MNIRNQISPTSYLFDYIDQLEWGAQYWSANREWICHCRHRYHLFLCEERLKQQPPPILPVGIEPFPIGLIDDIKVENEATSIGMNGLKSLDYWIDKSFRMGNTEPLLELLKIAKKPQTGPPLKPKNSSAPLSTLLKKTYRLTKRDKGTIEVIAVIIDNLLKNKKAYREPTSKDLDAFKGIQGIQGSLFRITTYRCYTHGMGWSSIPAVVLRQDIHQLIKDKCLDNARQDINDVIKKQHQDEDIHSKYELYDREAQKMNINVLDLRDKKWTLPTLKAKLQQWGFQGPDVSVLAEDFLTRKKPL